MKLIGMILVAYSVSIALIVLAGYMMSIHQKGAGWVIVAAVVCGIKDISWKENDKKNKIEN